MGAGAFGHRSLDRIVDDRIAGSVENSDARNGSVGGREVDGRLFAGHGKQAGALGAQQEAAIRRDNRRQTGETIAAFGGNGITLSGSAKDYTLAQQVELEMKALDARYQSSEQARAYRNSAKMTRYQGKQAQMAGFIGGASKLLSAGGQYLERTAPKG